MIKEKSEYKDLGDNLNDLVDNVITAFDKLGDATMDKLENVTDKTGDAIERISDRLGNSLVLHMVEAYQARKGLLKGDRSLVNGLSDEVLSGWLEVRRSIAEGFRKQAQGAREMVVTNNDKSKDAERYIEEISEARAEGFENDVKIIEEELKERGIEL